MYSNRLANEGNFSLSDNEPILKKQLRAFKDIEEIDEVIVVTGYLIEKIEKKVNEWGYGDFVKIAYNPFYKVSNNLISLWFGTHFLKYDIIITNGDNLFKKSVIEKLVAGDDGIFLVVDKKRE